MHYLIDLRGFIVKKGSGKRYIVPLIALALICVAAVELVVCRFADPELFRSITDPVVNTVQAASSAVSSAVTSAAADLARRITTAVEDARERRRQEELAEKPVDIPEEPVALAENQVSTAPLLISSAPVCDPSVTHLATVDGLQYLTGGLIDVVYYYQGDKLWENRYYGTDKISTHACGPTAMAMVVSSMTDTIMDPPAMAQWAVSHGHWAKGSGSYHSIVMGIASDFGLEAESFPSRDVNDMLDTLLSGDLLVALMGPGHFTQRGHFIVLRGVTLTGEILVADPNSPDNSLKAWDPQLLLDELSKSTASGSPLWVISAPKGDISQ